MKFARNIAAVFTRTSRRSRRFLARRVLHTNDSAHAVALGASSAVFVAFLPLVGIQTVLAVVLAGILKANKAICIPIVWITNPFTIVPIYLGSHSLGRFVLRSSDSAGQQSIDRIVQLSHSGSIFTTSFWIDLAEVLVEVGVELWVGCLIVGTVFSLGSYFLTRWAVSAYRERRQRRLKAKGRLPAGLVAAANSKTEAA